MADRLLMLDNSRDSTIYMDVVLKREISSITENTSLVDSVEQARNALSSDPGLYLAFLVEPLPFMKMPEKLDDLRKFMAYSIRQMPVVVYTTDFRDLKANYQFEKDQHYSAAVRKLSDRCQSREMINTLEILL